MYNFFFLIICLFLSMSSFGQTNLDLKSFIDLAKKNDPNLQTIIAERLRAKYLVDLNLPSRQYLLSVRNEYGFTRDAPGTTVLGATVSKTLLESGTRFSVGKTITERPDRNEDLTELRIEQSLYRNAFGSQVRDLKKNLELQKSVIELQVIEAYEDYLQNIINQYLDLTLAHLNYQTAERLHKESKVLLENVEKRKVRNVASDTDLRRAELQTILRQENELQSRTNLESLSRTLGQLIGDEKVQLVIPETILEMEKRLGNIDQNINDFLNLSRSRLIYDRQELASDANLELVKENKKPEANLLLGFNIDKSTRFGTTINREEVVVGMRVDIPFDDSLTQARINQASYELLKSKLQKKSFDNAIKESLFVIRNRILRQKEQLLISKKKKDLAAKIVEEETRRYQVGRITLEDLMQDKNTEAQYEFAYLGELTNLNKLIVQWLALTDQLATKLDL